MKILITGAAGFIGFHVARRFLDDGYEIVGIDNLNNYYDVNLKKDRLRELEPFEKFQFRKMDVSNLDDLRQLFEKHSFEKVIHLAAQAGVRYSITHPFAYSNSNLVGFVNILEMCRQNDISGLIYASSSSVYGGNMKLPFSESDNVDHPISLYAATKKANELMAHTYSHLYKLPTTGLRFFTVYGPWGRPDMALYKFTKAIFQGEPIPVFNYGKHQRSFTFIDDIVESLSRLFEKTENSEPYRIFNIGGSNSIQLMDYIRELEKQIGKKAEIEFLPKQPGDVENTEADTALLDETVDFTPQIGIEEGIGKFVNWFREYHNV